MRSRKRARRKSGTALEEKTRAALTNAGNGGIGRPSNHERRRVTAQTALQHQFRKARGARRASIRDRRLMAAINRTIRGAVWRPLAK
jgi:hypothetical protein